MAEPNEPVSSCYEKSRSSLKAKKVLWKSRRKKLNDDASSYEWFGGLNRGVGYTRRQIQHHRFRHPHPDQSQKV